ncbi:MAG: lytic murein transglycosylase [Patescibacteria group bacterium]
MKTFLLVDIRKRRNNSRLNLSFNPQIAIPIKKLLKAILILPIVLFFIFGSAAAPVSGGAQAAQNENERKALEDQLSELENQISNYETTIEQYKKQGKNLQSEVKRLESQISKLNLQIKAVNLTLNKLDSEIAGAQGQINQTESEIDFNKGNLSKLLQVLYENDKQSLMEILFKNPQLSDFFGDVNNMLAVQENLRIVIVKVIEARQKLIDQKEILALERDDAVVLKAYQDAQRLNIKKIQSDKNSLLKVTKGKESEYQKILVETKKTAAEIRKQIFKMLGGGELSFEEAYQFAKFAESATGVRAALLLAVLDRESALGKNVGRCGYKTAMSPGIPARPNRRDDISIFMRITSELGIDPNSIMVSCANADGAFGGAMGPAQFIPSTWQLYENKIAEVTGSNPPSPWRNADAFAATALYLKNAGAGKGASLTDERKAAAKYYAGSRWSRYLWTYGAKVISQAQKFEEDIAILSS